jgi:pimeloyl-ACP methyl ester carboxylesterase
LCHNASTGTTLHRNERNFMKTASMPWWQQLPEDFHLSVQETDIDHRHALKIKGTAALDIVLRTGLATAVLGAMAPNIFSSERLRRDMALMPFYAELADHGDPALVFATPPDDIPIQRSKAPLLGYRPGSIPCELLTFTSPYRTLNPAVRADYASHHANHQVYAQHWTHPSGPRPTLIFTHGFVADSYALNSIGFSLRWFYKKGYDILLYTLPFHGYRQGRLHPFSGFGYFANGFAQVNEAMLQSVHDLRILMNYLQARGVPSMGASGLSLGGYITALTACADDRLAFAIPNAPVVCPIDMLMEWAPLSHVFRYALPRLGLSVTQMRHLSAIHSPLNYAPQLPADRLLIIGGAGDRFTAPRYVKLLHEHWAGSQLHWFPGNHVLHLHQGSYLRLMRQCMDRCTQ